ncbi:MAG: polyketide antibiotic transporter [Nocardioides sp.]
MTGTLTLLRSYLRRDRWLVLWWSVAGTLVYYSQAVSVKGLYATQAEFDKAAASMQGNAAFVAMAGPARALNTIGGQVTWQATGGGAVVAGLMTMLVIGRHTRAEEESGRDELVRSTAIDRTAPMAAALGAALVANVFLGALVAVSLWTFPLAAADSWALGVGLALCGMCFGGVALLAAQLTSTTRATYGLTGATIGLAFALRAVGDVTNGALSWLSPIGWYQAMHPFSGLRWWPALLILAAAGLATAAAYAVFARRDVGSGVLAARPGPASGGTGGSWALAWRLQRGQVVGWSAGLLFTGLAYGSIGDSVGDLVGDSQATRDVFVQAGDLVDGFYATAILMLGMISAGFAVSSALRPRGEEQDGRLEPLLATALSRRRWLVDQVLVTVLGTCVVVVAAAVGLATGYALTTGDASAYGRYGLPMLAQLPAVLVLSGLARLAYGVAPRWATLAWLGLAWAVVVLLFGELWQLPQWARDVSPFAHLALAPGEPFRWLPVAAVAGVALLLSAAGQWAFVRRDAGS